MSQVPETAGSSSRAGETGPGEERVVIRDKRRIDPATGSARPVPDSGPAAVTVTPAADERVTELTADLQRLKAEYDNYRRRVDRDRALVAEQAVAGVLGGLLPVLDDLDRARAHGDLTGAFAAVADSLGSLVAKLGLEAFGEAGEPFDPMVHEALLHSTSAEVGEPVASEVLRAGYRYAGRVLRPAQVAVTAPAAGEGDLGGPVVDSVVQHYGARHDVVDHDEGEPAPTGGGTPGPAQS